MSKKRNAVAFTLTMPGTEPIELGCLAWPWAIQAVTDYGDYMEIRDRHGASVVALEDIALSNLSR